MTSQLTWLDFSEAQQRGIRDVLRNYEDKGTVDDLGFGTVRDAISNGLFPGTSIIQTRARYFLFVPWIFMEAQRRWPQQLVGKAADMERKLIDALKTASDTDGVIGKSVGQNLKTLPSYIYWAGLQQFGIFKLKGKTIRQFGRIASREVIRSEYEGEVVDQHTSYWADPPQPPSQFFRFESADLLLTKVEADWLAERIISTSNNLSGASLLSELVTKVRTGDTSLLDASDVWDLRFDKSISSVNRELLFHAERFSLFTNGLSLLYNEKLCELLRSERSEFGPDLDYVPALEEWAASAESVDLLSWCQQLDAFWGCLNGIGSVVPPVTRQFIDDAAQLLVQSGSYDLLLIDGLEQLVKERERIHKRSQARFTNRSRLHAYSGDAGIRPMNFRWGLVSRLLRDIADGCESVGR